MIALDLPRQVIFNGATAGLTLGAIALGVILVYRSTRVINFAAAEMGALGAAVLVRFVVNWNWNFLVAFVVCTALGGLLGAAVELLVVRRLFDAPRVVLLVATIGLAQLLLVVQYSLPDLTAYSGFPTPFTVTWNIGGVLVNGEHLLVLTVLTVVALGLALFRARTKYGIAIRASASNRDAARLSGISVKRMSTTVWVIAAVLAVASTILTAPLSSATAAANGTISIGPGLLLRALVAALLGRMRSMPVALGAGVAIGIAEAVVFYNWPDERGLLDAVLFVVVLASVLVLVRGEKAAISGGRWSFSPRVRPVPASLDQVRWVRRLPQAGAGAGLVAAVLLPFVITSPSQQFLFARVLLYALVALSLTVLTGWAGQLSLGQFAIAGLGAFSAAALVREGVPFGTALVLATVIGAVAALVMGAPALRISGLYLAVVTMAFAVATASWLLFRPIFTEDRSIATLPRPLIGSISLVGQRAYYLASLVALVVVVAAVSRIRRSGVGRALLAVRDNEQAAASFGLSPTRVKLTAFGTAGAMAGLAGGLLAGLFVDLSPDRFIAIDSLQVVAIAVIGGLSSVTGVLLGSLWVIGIPALFDETPEVRLLTSSAGLLVLLLYLPGGLVQVLYGARDMLFEWAARRLPAQEPPRAPLPVRTVELATDGASAPQTALGVSGLHVRFGGIAALTDVSLEVRRGEVVGLIGSNGAGKSTLMNAVGGFVASDGRIELLGHAVTSLTPARRARLGLGRTFQGAELFGDLTVTETVAIAVESSAHAGLAAVVLGLPRARRLERAKRATAEEVLAFLGLGRFADRFISELSTGTRRIVELACLFARQTPVLCLDEPTAGIAQRETEAFGPLLLRIRDELQASMLVIEHDMPLVLSISDRVYCLEAGRVIAEGTPAEVQADPLVIASYLGTDEEAIARSGALA